MLATGCAGSAGRRMGGGGGVGDTGVTGRESSCGGGRKISSFGPVASGIHPSGGTSTGGCEGEGGRSCMGIGGGTSPSSSERGAGWATGMPIGVAARECEGEGILSGVTSVGTRRVGAWCATSGT